MNLIFSYIFQSHLLAPHIIIMYYCLKKISRLHTVHLHKHHSCQQVWQFHHSFCWSALYCWVIKSCHPSMTAHRCVLFCVNDILQLIFMSCFVSVTVCSLLLYPLFIDCFSVFHSVCLPLSQLYSQYFTFSTSSCSCSQSTLNTVTQLWLCVKDCCCVMISDWW